MRQVLILTALLALLATACASESTDTGEAVEAEQVEATAEVAEPAGEPTDPEVAAEPSEEVAATTEETDAATQDVAVACENESLTLTQSTSGFLYLPSYVAEGAGFYEENGLEMDIVDLGGGAESIAAVVGGSADVALSAYSSVVNARNEGAPIITAGGLMSQYASNVVISAEAADAAGVTADSSVEEKIAALQGLNIGITSPGSGTDQLIRFMLSSEGLDPDTDATILPIGGGSPMLAAFEQGQIDAFALSSPTSNLAVAENDGVLLFNLSQGEYPPLDGFLYIVSIINESTSTDRPEVVTCFQRAIQQALDMIQDDPEAAMEAAQPVAFADLDPEIYADAFEGNRAAYVDSVVVDEGLAQRAVDFLAEFDDTAVDVDIPSTIDNGPAEAAVQSLGE